MQQAERPVKIPQDALPEGWRPLHSTSVDAPPAQGFGQPNGYAGPTGLAGLIHDARNMVSAMDLYCDLLEEPGVLSAPYRRYASELRLVGRACRRLLEDLAMAGCTSELQPCLFEPSFSALSPNSMPQMKNRKSYRSAFLNGQPVQSLAEELEANRNLLAALVGPAVTVSLSITGGARPVAITRDDLTRILVNLTRNAAEAMPGGGSLQIKLREGPESLTLSFADNGPGIPEEKLDAIFSSGYSQHRKPDTAPNSGVWPAGNRGQACVQAHGQNRGLGLSIVRSIVSAAGGRVWAANRNGKTSQNDETSAAKCATGAVICIEFPLRGSPTSP
jgi:signal transduction histidine kinase